MTLFFFMINILAKNYAILINSSTKFLNYRHFSNLIALQTILKNNNFEPEFSFLFSPLNVLHDAKNLYKNDVYLNEDEKLQPNTSNLLLYNTFEFIINVLYFNHNKFKYINENDTVLIYLCGHGREGFLKFMDMFFLFKDDLKGIIENVSKRTKRALIILDTCQALSLIDVDAIPDNVTVICTSLEEEFSYSTNTNTNLGVYTVDDFMYVLYTNFQNEIKSNITLEDLASQVNTMISSHVTVVGGGRTMDFFSSSDKTDRTKKFVI